MMRIVFFLCVLMLSACATGGGTQTVTRALAPDVIIDIPERPIFEGGLDVVQLVQARYQDRHQMFQSFLHSDGNGLNVVMTVPSGPRIMRIVWGANGVATTREPIAPDELDAFHIIADLMLVYAPLNELQNSISGAVVKDMADGTRKILRNGKEVIVVQRPRQDRWDGSARLENFSFDYVLNIQSQRVRQ
tara:strand:+ start:6864 stop:7433 length:570 start_codon:yes stop_codon:yes gene_type:complete